MMSGTEKPFQEQQKAKEKHVRTIQELAIDALQVQHACNLSGVAYDFSKAIAELRTLLPEAGTNEINTHPISKLWAYKMADLAEVEFETVADAMKACRQLAEG